jgi:hypothetical protein
MTFTVPPGASSAVMVASLSRVSHSLADAATELRLMIDGVTPIGQSSFRCPEQNACEPPFLHGVVTQLAEGPHTAVLEYKTASGTDSVAYFGVNGTHTHTPAVRRISVQASHAEEVVFATWSSSVSGSAANWAAVPGSAMALSRDLSGGEWGSNQAGSLLVLANLPAVRTEAADTNVQFRIVVNGQVVGRANSAGCPETACAAISFHGVAQNLSSTGPAANDPDAEVSVQYRVPSGGTVLFGQPEPGSAAARPRQLTTLASAVTELTTYSWTHTMSGSSQSWAHVMNLTFESNASSVDGPSAVLVLASLSRVQAEASGTPVQLQLLVNGVEVAFWQASAPLGYDYASPTLHGVADLVSGTHTAEVRYRLPQGGTVHFPDSIAQGEQYRRLTVLTNRALHFNDTTKFADCWSEAGANLPVTISLYGTSQDRTYLSTSADGSLSLWSAASANEQWRVNETGGQLHIQADAAVSEAQSRT